MKCKEYIEKIVNDNGDMHALTTILCESIHKLEEPEQAEMCDRLYVLAYGEMLTEEMAHECVGNMLPYGEHWTMAQTTSVGSSFGFDRYSKVSFYYVMNMLYNDFHNVLGDDTNTYVKLAKAWLTDEDAPNGDAKAYKYVKAMK